jgi:hypothetical protein
MGEGFQALLGDDLDPSQGGQLVEPGVGVEAVGDQDPLDVAGAGGLEDRVPSVDEVDPRPLG